MVKHHDFLESGDIPDIPKGQRDQNHQSGTPMQANIYSEIVKIRKWIVFFGVLTIISLIGTLIYFIGSIIDA